MRSSSSLSVKRGQRGAEQRHRQFDREQIPCAFLSDPTPNPKSTSVLCSDTVSPIHGPQEVPTRPTDRPSQSPNAAGRARKASSSKTGESLKYVDWEHHDDVGGGGGERGIDSYSTKRGAEQRKLGEGQTGGRLSCQLRLRSNLVEQKAKVGNTDGERVPTLAPERKAGVLPREVETSRGSCSVEEASGRRLRCAW